MQYDFRILNVFAVPGEPLSGNPLCVFEDGRGLTTEQMQALALQFNLSETTFLLPSTTATARVRIFTPFFEMPFAGHPTLGSAHVARERYGGGNVVTLEMTAGAIPVTAEASQWTLRANAPHTRAPDASPEQLAAMLGLTEADLGTQPLWVNTGVEQLIVPLRSAEAVRRARPDPLLLSRHGGTAERYLAYVFAESGDHIVARFFFGRGTSLAEDPATGSAAANLGGWFLSQHARTPLDKTILQGKQVRRPSQLRLRIDARNDIFVSGCVLELGRGTVEL